MLDLSRRGAPRRAAPTVALQAPRPPLAPLLAPLLALGLGACLSGPPPVRYLLEPAVVQDTRSLPLSLDSIGLATVSVPGYVKDSAIVARGQGARLAIDEDANWAEAPDAALTRVLAESLRLRAGSVVLVEPLPRGYEPGARVEVAFDRLLADGVGGADLAGQIRLIDGDGRRLLDVMPFRLVQRGGGDDFGGFFEALSLALDDLARLIVARLAEIPA